MSNLSALWYRTHATLSKLPKHGEKIRNNFSVFALVITALYVSILTRQKEFARRGKMKKICDEYMISELL